MAGDQTEARRARMRELWNKPDKTVAEILIEEGFGGPEKRTAVGKARHLATMTRNVWNDRKWWKKQWRESKRATTQDVNESRGEYLARLDSLVADAGRLLDDKGMKGTPRVQALSELRQLEQAKAKAHGVDAAIEQDPDDSDARPRQKVLVYVVNESNSSEESRETYGLGRGKKKG
ncbi:MAG TPA: hypothetical protein VLC46_16470 [Thermoanaerobaculia bacterium]|jgi:hypothetical protein|nr:hypothetical protein [Thermoanaerobaculia bacterium]